MQVKQSKAGTMQFLTAGSYDSVGILQRADLGRHFCFMDCVQYLWHRFSQDALIWDVFNRWLTIHAFLCIILLKVPVDDWFQ